MSRPASAQPSIVVTIAHVGALLIVVGFVLVVLIAAAPILGRGF
jgi:hypothetical protein